MHGSDKFIVISSHGLPTSQWLMLNLLTLSALKFQNFIMKNNKNSAVK